MNWLELFAASLGVASVWFARKENRLVFPFGIANVLSYIYICIETNLYANAGINAVYFISNIYGWYNWSRKEKNNTRLRISRNTRRQNLLAWLSVMTLYVVVLSILLNSNTYKQAYLPYVDALNTSFFLIATVLMAFKKVENWVFWIVGNIVSIPVYASQGLFSTSIQYSVFLILAILGYKEWKRKIAD